MSTGITGEDEALIKNEFVMKLDGLHRWPELRKIPNNLKNIIRSAIVFQSEGRSNSLLVITSDDKVYGLGENGSDTNILGFNCRHFECERIEQLELVKGLSGKNIEHIAVGCNVGAAIGREGRIYWWGNCDEVDDEIATPHLAYAPSMSTRTNNIKFTQVSCGSRFMAALAHTGNVYVWGKLKAGRSSMFMRKVMLDTSPHRIIKLTTGKNHLVMLTTEGAVYTWGCNDYGQRGILQDDNDEYSITKLQLNQPCKDIVCGLSSTIVLTSNGEVWACGENYWGTQVGYSAQIERVDLGCKIEKIIVGWCCVAGAFQSLYVATYGNGEHFVWSDTTAPAEKVDTPLMDLFPEGITPRDIMVSVLQLPPKQRNVKCLNCMKSDQIQFVLKDIEEKFNLLEDITAEMIRDLLNVTPAETSGRELESKTSLSTVSTQTNSDDQNCVSETTEEQK